MSFTEDVADALGDQSGEALARLKAVAVDPILPLADVAEAKRLSALCADLHEEASLAREGYRLAMRGLLTLIAIEVVRLAVSRARSGAVTLSRYDARVDELRRLVDEHFRKERLISFYAEKLAMTPDRLNDHVKRATGVTAGHLIRQRVLTEAKRQLVFTNQAIHEIAYDLAFSDPSHFARFFRKQTGMTPQASATAAAARLFLSVQGILPDNDGRDDRPDQFRQSGGDHRRPQAGHEARTRAAAGSHERPMQEP